jgi:DNA (cytosine-5)-methyltransferase 1
MIKVLELFAGIGACSKALERLRIEHEIVDAVEIDKYAITSFNAIHGTKFEVQDITRWDKDVEVDLIMHGSPCQDFSVAGKQAGGDIGSGTRSSLMYETIRIVGKLRPKYVLWENVKNLLSKKHKHNFDAYIETMNILGYNSYYQVLNAKDYGIPQNRERVFTVSIRKDIDKSDFRFPKKEELKLRLKDMLEDEADEKYYLSDEQINKIQTSDFMQEKKRIQEKDYSDTILARDWKDPKCVRIGNIYGEDKGTGYAGNVWDDNGLSPALNTMSGGNRQPMIPIKNATKKGYDEAIEGDSINLSYPESTTRRGRVGHGVAQTLQCNDSMGVVEKEYERTPLKFLNRNQKNIDGDYAFCIDSCNTGGVKEINGSNLRIRKLTPKECWRLMRI